MSPDGGGCSQCVGEGADPLGTAGGGTVQWGGGPVPAHSALYVHLNGQGVENINEGDG